MSHDFELSIEFFPPQTAEGMDKLRITRDKLAVLKPTFFSVTYGAGGSTQERTFEAVFDTQDAGVAGGYDAAPHLSCVGSSKDSIRAILQRYQDRGIRRIVALRGDLPSGTGDPGELRYANELVEFIRAETGDHFHIEVAAYPEWHPQARSPRDDLLAFKRKVDAGADSAITQYFFNADAYEHFVAECQALGITTPIVPGIMPIASSSQLIRFSDACGAEVPRWLRLRLQELGDDVEAVKAFGLDVVTQLCEQLRQGGAPSLHFYTMNQSGATLELCRRLGLGQ